MARYRKKPAEIEAVQWFENGDHPDDGPRDQEGQVVRYFRRPEPEYAGDKIHEACGRTWHEHGWIDTLEGGHTVCPGDWIITGVQGERYPCKPEIFEATYEPVEAADEMVLTWRGEEIRTIGDLNRVVGDIAGIEDDEEARQTAQEFMEAYRAVTEHAETNVGYISGYFGHPIMERIQELFDVSHPIFGRRTDVTPEEAFEAGERMAKGEA